METLWIALGLIIGITAGWAVYRLLWSHRERALQAEFNLWHQQRVQVERADALTASRRVLVGKYVEQFVPFQVPYAPADMRFLGSPIDYIIFNGLHADECTEVVFLEVKTNNATLTSRERSIREAIKQGRIRWQEVQLSTNQSRN